MPALMHITITGFIADICGEPEWQARILPAKIARASVLGVRLEEEVH